MDALRSHPVLALLLVVAGAQAIAYVAAWRARRRVGELGVLPRVAPVGAVAAAIAGVLSTSGSSVAVRAAVAIVAAVVAGALLTWSDRRVRAQFSQAQSSVAEARGQLVLARVEHDERERQRAFLAENWAEFERVAQRTMPAERIEEIRSQVFSSTV